MDTIRSKTGGWHFSAALIPALIFSYLFLFCGGANAGLKRIDLPKPRMEGGMPLMQALMKRSTSRDFAPDPLPMQTLSDLLWAADGVNRPEAGKRTAPTAMNWQEIDIYVALPDGIYVYVAAGHALDPVAEGDYRARTGVQPMAAQAPVSFVFVADLAKMKGISKKEKELYSGTDTGFISQNIYLFCASEGLATGVRGLVDRPALSALLKLRKDQEIILAQSAGYPKK